MTLPAGVTKLGSFKGAKGDKGNTGSIAFATAKKVSWTENPTVMMIGPESNRGAAFTIPMPLPSPETVNNDVATSALIKNPTATRDALLEQGAEDRARAIVAPDSITDPSKGLAQQLPFWVRGRVTARLGLGPFRIACVGDSTTAGVYSDSYSNAPGTPNQGGPNSYPAQLAKVLQGLGIPAEYSFALPGHSGNDDDRWDIGTGWAYAPFGAAANSSLTGNNPAGDLVLTPGHKANRYRIYYYGDSGTGTIRATATGGALTSSPAVSEPKFYFFDVSAPVASEANTLTLEATGTVFIAGVEWWDSARPNTVRILNLGVGSSTSDAWADNSHPAKSSANLLLAIQPYLAITSLGINDQNAPGWDDVTGPARVLGNIDWLLDNGIAGADRLLMSAFPHDNPALDALNEAYRLSGMPYVDIQARWRRDAMAYGLIAGDNTHPNAFGYGDVAQAVANLLMAI